jgi:hypothetical protein
MWYFILALIGPFLMIVSGIVKKTPKDIRKYFINFKG